MKTATITIDSAHVPLANGGGVWITNPATSAWDFAREVLAAFGINL